METAKDTDLPDLLEHLGYQLKRIGRYYTTQEMDSIRIKDRRTWKRYSSGTGGDAITFLQEFEGKGFREAVEYLLDFNGQTRDSSRTNRPRPPPEEEERPEFVLPPANRDNRRVFACVVAKSAQLRFRLRRKLHSLPCSPFPIEPASLGFDGSPMASGGIAPQVIRAFLNTGLLYEDEKYHNCVFVGRDNPYLRHVVLCLDADDPGRTATEKLRAEYEGRGLKVSTRAPAKGKDWNEYLQQRGPPRERGR